MKLNRNLTHKIHLLFDQCLPPLLRDARWFMRIPFWFLFGNKTDMFLDFKEKAPKLTPEGFRKYYKETQSAHIERPTDLNNGCIREILNNITGESVLEVGCGRGFLTKQMAQKFRVTASDMCINESLPREIPKAVFVESFAEKLPFDDKKFDTVISTHTLEHLQNLPRALAELRRVARRRIIIVVPKQRPYRYTFDLHLNFFPYENSLIYSFDSKGRNYMLREIEGDWYYQENV